MRIVADLDRCEGHGLCAATAPGVYDLNDDATVVVASPEVPRELERQAEAGAHACPVAALRVDS